MMIAIDGQFVGRKIAYLPKGYHHVISFDNFSDVISCQKNFGRGEFIELMREGLEIYLHGDKSSAADAITAMSHASHMTVMCLQVFNDITDTNEALMWISKDERKTI